MALALRIDSVEQVGERIVISYTYEESPLPDEPSGECMDTTFDAMNEMLDQYNPQRLLLLLAYANWLTDNPDAATAMSQSKPILIKGGGGQSVPVSKVATFDPSDAATPVTIA